MALQVTPARSRAPRPCAFLSSPHTRGFRESRRVLRTERCLENLQVGAAQILSEPRTCALRPLSTPQSLFPEEAAIAVGEFQGPAS